MQVKIDCRVVMVVKEEKWYLEDKKTGSRPQSWTQPQ
jgi:hypothetical protein